MLLDFLDGDDTTNPMLRFYDWTEGEDQLLRQSAELLATGTSRSIEVHQLPFVEAIGGITFTWVADPWDRGVLLPDDRRTFVMQLPPDEWAEVAKVIRRFNGNVRGFDWLLPVTQVEILFSWSGGW